jgi:hypothetical protein
VLELRKRQAQRGCCAHIRTLHHITATEIYLSTLPHKRLSEYSTGKTEGAHAACREMKRRHKENPELTCA